MVDRMRRHIQPGVMRVSLPSLRREVSAAPRARRRAARDVCVVRRRRDVTAGAPDSGSRVILCPLHHATPADGAPRCCSYCMCCVFLPRPSVVKQRFQPGALIAC
jgi:hypothetical protein